MYSVVQDVTARRLAEKVLAESEERFRSIANSAPVPMWVTRLGGRREFVNRAYQDFLGVSLRRGRELRLAQGASSGRSRANFAKNRWRERAHCKPFTLEARYRARRWSMALAAFGIAAPLGPERRTHRLHRRRPRRDRLEGGRAEADESSTRRWKRGSQSGRSRLTATRGADPDVFQPLVRMSRRADRGRRRPVPL